MKAKKEYDSNYDMVSTECEKERFQRKKEENNKMENYFDFDNYYLKYIDKINVKEIKIGIEFIFFICQLVDSQVKKPAYTQTNNDYKIIIKDKKFNNLGEIEIERKVNYIGEIKEKEDYEIIISMDGNLYKLSNNFNQIEFICAMSINEIIQINKNEYIISNNNGTFKYEGSIINLTKENLEIEEKKIKDKNCNFGVLINERIIALAYNDKLILYNNNSNETEKEYNYENFCESCYAFFKSKVLMFYGTNKIENNILLFGCKKGKENGFLIVDVETTKEKFIETNDFEIHSFLQIKGNEEEMIKAFSEEYDKKYTYFLVGGYENNKNKIKLYRFYQWKGEIEFIKDIGIDNNDIFKNGDKLSIKSIIQYEDNNMIITDNKGDNKGETIKLNIENMENKKKIKKEEEKEEVVKRNKEYYEFCNNNYENYLYELKDIDMSKLKINSIENVYQLENGYYIIAQKNNFSVVFIEDNYIIPYGDFDIPDSINCICENKKSQVIISQNDGLSKLVFPNSEDNNEDKARKDKINDKKLNIFSNKNDNIVSCDIGTFKPNRDIPSINDNDLNAQNKLYDKKYYLGKIIEINNLKLSILINKNELNIFDINNIQNKYERVESNYNYILSNNCIVSFKTKKDSNNHIFICALKSNENKKNRILFLNIRLPLQKSIEEIVKDTENFQITCMCPFKLNNEEEECCSHFLVGGINKQNEVEIYLYKIKDSDEQFKNSISIESVKRIFYDKDNEEMTTIISMYQSIIDGELIIFSNERIYKLDIQKKLKEKE